MLGTFNSKMFCCVTQKTGSEWQFGNVLIEAWSLIQVGGRGQMFQYKPVASITSFTVLLLTSTYKSSAR